MRPARYFFVIQLSNSRTYGRECGRWNIIEQGRHKELLAKGGAYASLYYSQFE